MLLSGKEQPSQVSQSAAATTAAAATVPEADKEDDDMPPIQNTLDSQPGEGEAVEKPFSPTPAPAGPSATPQLPQQSLVDKLNEVAEEAPVLPAAAGTEDGSIAFVTTPGLAEGIQTTTDAAGKAGTPNAERTVDQGADKARDGPSAEEEGQTKERPANRRTSRAAKVAASAKIASAAIAGSGGRRASTASRPSAEKKKAAEETAADSNNKENDGSAPPTVGGQEASHMAVKEPHSRVDEAQGFKASNKKKAAGKEGRDELIGRCVKKAFQTDSGLNTYTGWVIGKHATKNW